MPQPEGPHCPPSGISTYPSYHLLLLIYYNVRCSSPFQIFSYTQNERTNPTPISSKNLMYPIQYKIICKLKFDSIIYTLFFYSKQNPLHSLGKNNNTTTNPNCRHRKPSNRYSATGGLS